MRSKLLTSSYAQIFVFAPLNDMLFKCMVTRYLLPSKLSTKLRSIH